jgi:hypothetical protein
MSTADSISELPYVSHHTKVARESKRGGQNCPPHPYVDMLSMRSL